MNSVEITIFSIILMVFLGFTLKKINLLKESAVDSLNKIVINICLPCMVFNVLYMADISLLPKLGILPLILISSSLIIGSISYILLKIFGYSNKKIWSILITVVLGNTAFMGFPVNMGIFNHDGLIRAIFCDMASMITFLILSFILVIVFGGTLKKAVKKILFFPPLWAVVFGIILNIFSLPIGPILDNVITYLAGGAIPLIMISLGLSIRFDGLKWNKFMITFTSIMKLFIFPLITCIIVLFLNLSGLEYNVTIIQAAMPSGMLAMVLAVTYGLDFRLTSDCILMNTLFSLLTLPILISII